jgi:hypothetical protein
MARHHSRVSSFRSRRSQSPFPSPAQSQGLVLKELRWIEENVGIRAGVVKVGDVQKFAMTAPGNGEV